jgi:pyruvate/2-oxoglutarate dehydrogenase complex dihydrolipoamide acyltransferase (E2) component
MTGTAFPRQRRHTLYFQEYLRGFAPVFLDTGVDMTRVLAHREGAGEHYSVVTYVVYAAGRVLARHPEAGATLVRRFLRGTRLRLPAEINAKITLDKRLGGRRVVLSTVLPGVNSAGLAEIQRLVRHYRDGDPATMPEFAPARGLHRLPEPVGRAAFRLAVRSPGRRSAMMGTFAVTSLGHRSVAGFHSVGGTTVTLGLGRVADRPVVRSRRVTVAPVLPLNLAFDHRVIDGAEAADVLEEIKDALENFTVGDRLSAGPEAIAVDA